MLNTEFTFNLTEPIKAGKVTIGYFDGVHPSIVAVTRSDKIFVHNPHNRSVYDPDSSVRASAPQDHGAAVGQFSTASGGNDLDFLNINQAITCLAAGQISPGALSVSGDSKTSSANSAKMTGPAGRRKSVPKKSQLNNDVLVVGTKTSIHVYDILHNSDLYYKEITDGANAVVIGKFGKVSEGNLAMIGGNCAIHGFDREGNDVYWTVTGDNISAMALVDIDNDGENELVVGSVDNEIQVFKKDAIIIELRETDKISCLCALGTHMFAYALSNGTVGVYQTNGERLWRIKSKNQPVSLLGADVNNDGQVELLTGWSNGKLDIRVAHTGEVINRENLKNPIAGIMIADYNMDGKKELIVCTVVGEVFGFRLETHEEHQQIVSSNYEQDTIRELMKRKQALMHELHNYEENYRIQNIVDPSLLLNRGKVLNEKGDLYGAIPASTKVKSSLSLRQTADDTSGLIDLKLETTNDTEIRAAIVFAEGIFKHESIVIYPHDDLVSNQISVELRPAKDMAIDLHVKALVGYRASSHFHVFELSRHLPRFAMYGFVRSCSLEQQQQHPSNDNLPSITVNGDDNQQNSQVAIDEGFNEYPGAMGGITADLNRNDWDPIYSGLNNTISNQHFDAEVHQPQSYVVFRVNESLGKVIEWINSNFLLDQELELNEEERRIEFVSLRNQQALIFELLRGKEGIYQQSEQTMNSQVDSKFKLKSSNSQDRADNEESAFDNEFMASSFNAQSNENRYDLKRDSSVFDNIQMPNMITIYCDSMDLAGVCIQSMAGNYFGMTELPCYKAHFPDDIAKLKQLIDRVEEIQSVRQHLVAEVADSANLIRSAVVQAEDARLIEEYDRMKQIFNDLFMLNKEILREHTIRCQNHQDLVDSLKQINVIIQRASNLRIGSYKTSLINACREAIKQKNFAQLFRIISED